MGQSKIFVEEEANRYFERNQFKRTFVIDYLISQLPRRSLSHFDVAEFGIGGGQNLMLLKNYTRSCHGYDASSDGIACFEKFAQSSPEREQYYAKQVNLCEPFTTPIQYDLILYGFFAYYVTDDELAKVKLNLLQALKPTGLLFVYDFLSREYTVRPDSRNPSLQVYKRPFSFWTSHLAEFDLLDFRLFDNDKIIEYKYRDEQSTIDVDVPEDDSQWNFGALFRRRLSNNPK